MTKTYVGCFVIVASLLAWTDAHFAFGAPRFWSAATGAYGIRALEEDADDADDSDETRVLDGDFLKTSNHVLGLNNLLKKPHSTMTLA